MQPVLRLFEDFLTDRGEMSFPALPRMFFVVRGTAMCGARSLGPGGVTYGEDAVAVRAAESGATIWRWELSVDAPVPAPNGPGVSTREKLSAPLDTLPPGELLWRGDSVAFPPGGVAYLHRHHGPEIRCLIEGELRVDTKGSSHAYRVGKAWFEAGPDPVFAQAADRPTRFIRVMILPRALLGKSSIQYVNEEDRDKPKAQQYRVFVDVPLNAA